MRYVFSFDASEAQLIIDSLVKLPYFQVSALLANIQEQVRNQPRAPVSSIEPLQSTNEQPPERSDGM